METEIRKTFGKYTENASFEEINKETLYRNSWTFYSPKASLYRQEIYDYKNNTLVWGCQVEYGEDCLYKDFQSISDGVKFFKSVA
jgi:hypothetical protein